MFDEIDALIILNNIQGLGAVKIRQLLKAFGCATAVLSAPIQDLAALPGIGKQLIDKLQKAPLSSRWKQDKELLLRENIELITEAHPCYPSALRPLADRPALLYVKGDLSCLKNPMIAVVGTRAASPYGQYMAETLSRDLAARGITIASGLARGIDTAAHRGALDKGHTVAVIGSGLAKLYPKENTSLALSIANSGAVISEFPLLTPPDRHHFPQRNRIVSGMSAATLVIEAKTNGGALITAEKALKQKRPVFAIPGRVDSETFSGSHQLISEGKAQLIQSAEDILKALNWNTIHTPSPSLPLPTLHGEEQALWQKLPNEECNVEEIAQKVNLPVAKLNVLLTKLLLKKRVLKYPGNIYRKTG